MSVYYFEMLQKKAKVKLQYQKLLIYKAVFCLYIVT